MPANGLREIKRRIKSVKSTEHITNAMKLVSAAKLRRAKGIFDRTNQFFGFVTESIDEIFHNTRDIPEDFLEGNREINKSCYIVITSCRGLCGSFNANVIKEASALIDCDPEEPVIVAIGTKGRDHFAKKGYRIEEAYMLPPENISFVETHEISKPIIQMYKDKEIDEVILVYTSLVSALEQRVKTVTLLPFALPKEDHAVKLAKNVEYEPSAQEVFNYLVPKFVEISIYRAIVESATCEHAARRMAMDSATDNARDMISDLTLNFNRARQAAITQEISEIVGGSEALK